MPILWWSLIKNFQFNISFSLGSRWEKEARCGEVKFKFDLDFTTSFVILDKSLNLFVKYR